MKKPPLRGYLFIAAVTGAAFDLLIACIFASEYVLAAIVCFGAFSNLWLILDFVRRMETLPDPPRLYREAAKQAAARCAFKRLALAAQVIVNEGPCLYGDLRKALADDAVRMVLDEK